MPAVDVTLFIYWKSLALQAGLFTESYCIQQHTLFFKQVDIYMNILTFIQKSWGGTGKLGTSGIWDVNVRLHSAHQQSWTFLFSDNYKFSGRGM